MTNLPQNSAGANFTGVKPYDSRGSGRTILANAEHQQMLSGFKDMSTVSSSQGYHALAITNAVDSLRGNASPVNSFSKDGHPTRRCIVFSGFEIEYELNDNYYGGQTDVRIVDVRITLLGAEKANRASLWGASFNENSKSWESSEDPSLSLKSDGIQSGVDEASRIRVGINGYCGGLDHAVSMLPSHIARGEQRVIDDLKKHGYQLFYVPVDKNCAKAGWSFLKNLGTTASDDNNIQAAQILAGHMKSAYDRGLYVEWVSHRSGSMVLTEAMKLLAKRQVNVEAKQSIFLSDHTTSHYAADKARRSVGMDTRDSKWHNSAPGLAQMIGGQTFGAADLACSFNELFNHTKSEEIAGKAIDVGLGSYKAGKGTIASGAAVATLVAKMGITSAYATAVVQAIGLGVANMAVSSVPALTEGYHTNALAPTKQFANKGINSAVATFKKIFPGS